MRLCLAVDRDTPGIGCDRRTIMDLDDARHVADSALGGEPERKFDWSGGADQVGDLVGDRDVGSEQLVDQVENGDLGPPVGQEDPDGLHHVDQRPGGLVSEIRFGTQRQRRRGEALDRVHAVVRRRAHHPYEVVGREPVAAGCRRPVTSRACDRGDTGCGCEGQLLEALGAHIGVERHERRGIGDLCRHIHGHTCSRNERGTGGSQCDDGSIFIDRENLVLRSRTADGDLDVLAGLEALRRRCEPAPRTAGERVLAVRQRHIDGDGGLCGNQRGRRTVQIDDVGCKIGELARLVIDDDLDVVTAEGPSIDGQRRVVLRVVEVLCGGVPSLIELELHRKSKVGAVDVNNGACAHGQCPGRLQVHCGSRREIDAGVDGHGVGVTDGDGAPERLTGVEHDSVVAKATIDGQRGAAQGRADEFENKRVVAICHVDRERGPRRGERMVLTGVASDGEFEFSRPRSRLENQVIVSRRGNERQHPGNI